MSYGDPYYGGTEEVEHVWVRPPSPDCPDCRCCTTPLCTAAKAKGMPCWAVVDGGPDVMDVSGCPCAPMAGRSQS
ncbi:hypothetical protein E1166_26055 [Micromonospora sp. KC213]|nr:hypothetical protein E1166_26055 [Micromonospora sp. KC213]